MEYNVNNHTIRYEAAGERIWGKEEVMLENADNLAAGTSWAAQGFTVETLFQENVYGEFITKTEKLLKQLWHEAGLTVPQNLALENYHSISPDFETHLKAIEKTKLLSVKDFPIDINILVERVCDVCHTFLVPLNPFDNQRVFHFRVVRPNSYDNNPLHRDVWLEDYDDCINLYIPVAGSNALSSLVLIPGSHHWPESRIERTVSGAVINGRKFNVPSVTAIKGSYEVIRPNPGRNEVLIFSPYLIHGGAVNMNAEKTRISIEMRLWRGK